MEATSDSPREDAGRSDLSMLKSPIQLGMTGLLQLMQAYHVGTDEVKQALIHHCDLVMECKLCRSLFRGLPNFLAHKRHYCEDPNKNFEVSLENVRIVQPSSSGIFEDMQKTAHQGARPQSSLSPSKHGLLLRTLMGDNGGSPTKKDNVEGMVPITCEGISGLSSFMLHHKFIDKLGKLCNLCKFKVGADQNLRQHVQNIHFKRRTFLQCSHCSRVYKESGTFYSHLIMEHSIPTGTANKISKSDKSKIDKYVINGKVYDIAKSEKVKMMSHKDFREENRKTVLEMYKCLNVLEFKSGDGCKALCKVHSKHLEGFQNIRLHMVDFHLRQQSVCMFCQHETSSFGHIVKHMVVAHEFTIDRIKTMRNRIRRHFSLREEGDGDDEDDADAVDDDDDDDECCDEDVTMDSHYDSSQSKVYEEEDDVQIDSEPEEDAEDATWDPREGDHHTHRSPNKPVQGTKRKLEISSPEMTVKKQKRYEEPIIDLPKPVVPIPSLPGTKTLRKFIAENKLMSPTGKCRICSRTLATYKSQRNHLRTKHLSRQHVYQCKKCRLVFQKVAMFKKHMDEVHRLSIEDVSGFVVEKFILEGGKVYDIPKNYINVEKYSRTQTKIEPAALSPTPMVSPVKTMMPTPQQEITAESPPLEADTSQMSASVMYSEREMTLAMITCMYTIKFQTSSGQGAQCVHHPEVVLQSFTSIIEHLVLHHIKEDYSCFMCPFRRKDAMSLVKHMSGSHHLSVDRIQRMKEKMRSSFSATEIHGRSKMSLASMSLTSIEQIVAMLTSWSSCSRETHGSESVADEGSTGSRPSTPVSPTSPQVGISFLRAPSKDLVVALIDSLGILKFIARPAVYYTKATYIAECLQHPTCKMRGLPMILEHLVDHHLKLTNSCCLCSHKAPTLEHLGKHMSKAHAIDIHKILGMKEAIRFSLLRKGSSEDEESEAGTSSSTLRSSLFVPSPGIPCPPCGKRMSTFTKLKRHLKQVHCMPKDRVKDAVAKLTIQMQQANQKCKDERLKLHEENESSQVKISQEAASQEAASPEPASPEKKKTKSGRIVRRVSDGRLNTHSGLDTSKKSMFGWEDYVCTICTKVYPARASTAYHVQVVHGISKGECSKYITNPGVNFTLEACSSQSGADEGSGDHVNLVNEGYCIEADDVSEGVDISEVTVDTQEMEEATSEEGSQNYEEDGERSAEGESAPIRADRSERRSRRSQHLHDEYEAGTPSLFGIDDLPCVICMKSFPRSSQLIKHYMSHHHMERKQAHGMVQKLKYGSKPIEVTTEKKPEREPTSRRKQVSPKKSDTDTDEPAKITEAAPVVPHAEKAAPPVVSAAAKASRIENLLGKISKNVNLVVDTSESENVPDKAVSPSEESSQSNMSKDSKPESTTVKPTSPVRVSTRTESPNVKTSRSLSPRTERTLRKDSPGVSTLKKESPGAKTSQSVSPTGRLLRTESPTTRVLRTESPVSMVSKTVKGSETRNSSSKTSPRSNPSREDEVKIRCKSCGRWYSESTSTNAICSRCDST